MTTIKTQELQETLDVIGIIAKPIRQMIAVPIGYMGTGPTDLQSVTNTTKRYSNPLQLQAHHANPAAPQGILVQGVTTGGITATVVVKFFETYSACSSYAGTDTDVIATSNSATITGAWRQTDYIIFDTSKLEHTYPYARVLVTFDGSGTTYIKTDYCYIGVTGEV